MTLNELLVQGDRALGILSSSLNPESVLMLSAWPGINSGPGGLSVYGATNSGATPPFVSDPTRYLFASWRMPNVPAI